MSKYKSPTPYSTAELAAIRSASLSEPVGNVKEYRDTVIAALDFVFTGI